MTLTAATLPLPQFSQIKIEDLKHNIQQLLQQGQQLLQQVQASENFAEALATIDAFDDFENQFSEQFGVLSHLNAVMNTPELREVYQSLLPEISDFYTQIGQSEALYQNYQFVADQTQFQTLRPALQSAIRQAIKDFKLSGVALPQDKKAEFAKVAARLSQLSSDFSNHVLDATQDYVLALDDAQLKGLPESSKALLQQYGQQKGLQQAAATLDIPAYLAIMTYADDRQLRETLYQAYTTRASELGKTAFDNGPIMQEILALREQQAKLLGFNTFAELSLARKMAPSVEKVREFLLDLADKAQAPAQAEIAQLKDFAAQNDIDILQPWDSGYYAEKLKQKNFNLSQEALKPYFPINKVVNGLFAIAEKLYGIQIIQKQADVWHKDAKYYEVEEHGNVIGGFYFDLYARDQKRGGAWMSGFRSKIKDLTQDQKPVAFMVCNFAPPVGNQPAQLTHDEITTLFHEFGHGLHHILTEADHIGVAGTHAVAWDAVELPSQFMEFWAWEEQGIDLISAHIESGDPLDKALLEALFAARYFQTGMQTLRQLEFALFDLNIHDTVPAPDVAGIQQILDQVREKVAVLPTPAYNRFQYSFSHIFAGGYAAGYYSYKWAEVLASDAFDRFEQEGVFNAQTGQAFRQSILAVGGQIDALEAFKAFRGREPKIDALLRHSGWTN
ncbi:M3 family metallopeptidase [Acinetobacter qingfengensis]|uniref:oligopeptidase A n=1 Tax=Acinetobacter qingfengensis TaxID=1262585 RepID=A0A1E7QXN3_9GAMM|nr:M3 family metallopeptidase [Acinetobacter qingfengensis]KAA8731664.1 M3 family metallopeptidase [Acinetobacter qingfengensis]OEY91766.1 oligopeptidase A [Acinetobacter qingfengensis]